MAVVPPPGPLVEYRTGVWIQPSWIRVAGLTLQTRMIVLRLQGGLLLYSPTPPPLLDETRAAIEALGQPRWLVAPNEIHNVGLLAFQTAYPAVHTTGCIGHPRRVPKVRFDTLLDSSSPRDSVPWTASGELEFHVIGGNGFLHEIALLHRPSRTIVLADAVENIDPASHLDAPSRFKLAVLDRMGFHFGEPCMSPEHDLMSRDPAALRGSLEAVEAWDFDAMIIAHGALLEGRGARAALRKAFTATIATVERRSRPVRAILGLLGRLA
jgi:hypothetical protein